MVVSMGVLGHLRLMTSKGSSSVIDLSSKNSIAVGELLLIGNSASGIDEGRAIISQFSNASPIGRSSANPMSVQFFLVEHHFASLKPSPLEPNIRNISTTLWLIYQSRK
jgi:hypothetical protein